MMPAGMPCNRMYFLNEDGEYEEVGGVIDKKVELNEPTGDFSSLSGTEITIDLHMSRLDRMRFRKLIRKAIREAIR